MVPPSYARNNQRTIHRRASWKSVKFSILSASLLRVYLLYTLVQWCTENSRTCVDKFLNPSWTSCIKTLVHDLWSRVHSWILDIPCVYKAFGKIIILNPFSESESLGKLRSTLVQSSGEEKLSSSHLPWSPRGWALAAQGSMKTSSLYEGMLQQYWFWSSAVQVGTILLYGYKQFCVRSKPANLIRPPLFTFMKHLFIFFIAVVIIFLMKLNVFLEVLT
jgi:hypothetical protein